MLHLAAEDEADLQAISAQMQDALVKRADLRFDKKRRRFALVANRFAWDALPDKQRRRAGLRFDDVEAVQSAALPGLGDAILSLLAISFSEGDELSGTIVLTFSTGVQVRLKVETINVTLDDLGGTWSTDSLPGHGV